MAKKYVKNEAEGNNTMDRNMISKIVIGVAIIAVIILTRAFTVVPAGYVTVLDVFGSVNPAELSPGLNFPVNPLAQRIQVDTRTKESKEKIVVPTREGLMAGLDISLLYHVDPAKADELYKSVGTNFHSVIIQPMLRNVVRDVIAEFSSEDLYSQRRQSISSEISTRLTALYTQRGIILENVLLRDVILPSEVTSAIEQKIKAKQQAEQMEYVLQKEESEAKRKKIEAQGIADAQQVISQSLTPEYLQWRYITTLEGLVDSENTTFVVTPFDQKLIPMLPLEGKK